jgi:hypothetical protein
MRKYRERFRKDGVTIDWAGHTSYEEAIAGFSRQSLEATLAGDLEHGVNACIECCNRHASPGRVALRWRSRDGRQGEATFADLKERAPASSPSAELAGLGTTFPSYGPHTLGSISTAQELDHLARRRLDALPTAAAAVPSARRLLHSRPDS